MEFDHSTETISPDDTVPIIRIGGTGGLGLPAGNTMARPIGQGRGVLRLNTNSGRLEYNDAADVWSDIASTSYVDYVVDNASTELQVTLDSKLTNRNLTVTTDNTTAAKTTTESVTFFDGVLYNVLFTLGNSVNTPTINGIGVRLGTTPASTATFTVGANAVVPMLYVEATNTLQLMGSCHTSDSIGVNSMTDGTVAAPGWAFTSEAGVGFHRPTTGALSIVSNNGEQVRVSGVTNAVNYVELAGNIAGDGPIVGANGASNNIDLFFQPKGTGAVYTKNESSGLIFGTLNGAGATPNTQYLTFTNAASGSIPYFQSNGTDATVPIRYLTKSATGYHQFSTTTNNNILTLQSVASGVNSLTITNAATTGAPSIAVTGSDANININLTPKGAGGVNIASGPLLIGGNAGTSGQVLTSNGASTPSWQNVSVTVGSTAGVPIITTTGGVLSAGSFGTTAGTFCQGNDSRLSDTRNTTNSFVIKFDGGTNEGTDQYTFNGSAAKTINIVAGSNITLTEAAGQITIASTGSGGGTPGGSDGEIQYNNAGAGTFAGAANVKIEGGNLKMLPLASIPAAPAGGLVMFDRIHGGRHLPSVIGPAGVDIALQPALFGNSVYMWLPGAGTTLSINWGTSFISRNNGTGTGQAHPTKTSTNAMTSMNRATFSTGTTTTGAAGIQSSATVAWRGNAADLGGFFFFVRFGIETLATGQRTFVGLSANNATMAADPSLWNDTCGIGADSADTTWQIIMRGTAPTKTNTGITITAGQILDFAMFASPNGSNITCRVADAVTGTVLYDNTSFTTNLPTNTTFMYMQAHTQSTSGTTAKLLALNRMYVETDL